MVLIGFPLLEYVPHPHWLLSCRHEGPSQDDQIGAWLACFLIIALFMSTNKVFSINPRSTLGTSRDKICLAISPHSLLMSGDQFQDDHYPGRDAGSHVREMHHQGLARLRLKATTTFSFQHIHQCEDQHQSFWVTRSYAALWAADLDWIVGPGYRHRHKTWQTRGHNWPGRGAGQE